MKKIGFWLTTALISASAVGLGWTNRAEARTLVGCGPNLASYIVEEVPVGCYVLQTSYREPAVEDTDFQQTPASEDASTETIDGTTDTDIDTDTINTPTPGTDTQGPNTAPDTSPATPGTAIPEESPGIDTTTPGTTDGSTQPDADIQGPNAAPDTSPATPGTAIPGEAPQ